MVAILLGPGYNAGMSILFLRLWPAFIPLLLYVIWLWRRRYHSRKADLVQPRFFDGPWLITLISSLVIGIVCLLWLGLQPSKPNPQGGYQPKMFRDGKLIEQQP